MVLVSVGCISAFFYCHLLRVDECCASSKEQLFWVQSLTGSILKSDLTAKI